MTALQDSAKLIQTSVEYTKKIGLLKSEKNTAGQRLKAQQAKLVKIVVEIEALSDLLKAKSADQVHIESVIASYAEEIRRLDNAIKDLTIRAENSQVCHRGEE